MRACGSLLLAGLLLSGCASPLEPATVPYEPEQRPLEPLPEGCVTMPSDHNPYVWILVCDPPLP